MHVQLVTGLSWMHWSAYGSPQLDAGIQLVTGLGWMQAGHSMWNHTGLLLKVLQACWKNSSWFFHKKEDCTPNSSPLSWRFRRYSLLNIFPFWASVAIFHFWKCYSLNSFTPSSLYLEACLRRPSERFLWKLQVPKLKCVGVRWLQSWPKFRGANKFFRR